ncbi:hypothetical protein DL89DRAFT_264418, partial [Linderina pennispora]
MHVQDFFGSDAQRTSAVAQKHHPAPASLGRVHKRRWRRCQEASLFFQLFPSSASFPPLLTL